MRAESRYAAQIGPAIRVKNQPYHNQPLGTSSVDESDVGRKGGFVCGDKKLGKKLTLWGWVRHGQLASGRPISMGPPTCTPQTHHNQPRLSWVGAESARGWGSGCVLWCAFFWNFGRRVIFTASLICNRAGKFCCSTRSLASTV